MGMKLGAEHVCEIIQRYEMQYMWRYEFIPYSCYSLFLLESLNSVQPDKGSEKSCSKQTY